MNVYKSELLSTFPNLKQGFISNFDSRGIFSLADQIGLNTIQTVNQVHSDIMLKVSNEDFDKREADSLYTDIKGMGIGIYTADCLPIIYYAEEINVVGAIHAGWRGTLKEVVAKTFKYLIEELDCSRSKIYVAVGPCIERNCYEVGDDVAGEFISKFENHEMFITRKSGSKSYLDLKEANICQIKDSGITNIEFLMNCTFCDLNLPSYRRDGKNAGRIFSFIGLV